MLRNSTLDLTIVIVSYNSQFWLKKTLISLKKLYLDETALKVKVVVVDNHSADDSVKVVKRQFRWVQLIELPENIGFAAGNNVALKEVSSRYVMLLNSDMELTERSDFDRLVSLMDDHRRWAVISPQLTLYNGHLDLASHRGEPTLWASFTYFLGLEKLFSSSPLFGQYHQLHKPMNQGHEIDSCSGAAMVVRTAAMNKVGLLDERFFMYAEDLDWCKRFREAGYKIWFEPSIGVIHHKNKSGISSASRQIAVKTKTMFYDTMLQYYDKHYRNQHPEWVRTIIITILALKKGP